MSSNNDNPGLISGHAQYVKGAAVVRLRTPTLLFVTCFSSRANPNIRNQSAVGSATGSESWQQSGEQQKEQGVQEMKAAGDARDPQSQGFGKVEEFAGKAAGCEGMEQEGAASKKE